MATPKTEVWQRGPLPGIIPLLQPVAHALLQAQEELNEIIKDFPPELLWEKPAAMASVGFHLQHLSGVLDRVFTYARNEALTDTQFQYLKEEGTKSRYNNNVEYLVVQFNLQVDKAMEQIKNTDEHSLTEYRGVGRAGLPSTVIGLLVHAAEHTMRHIGQLMVTVAVLRNKEK